MQRTLAVWLFKEIDYSKRSLRLPEISRKAAAVVSAPETIARAATSNTKARTVMPGPQKGKDGYRYIDSAFEDLHPHRSSLRRIALTAEMMLATPSTSV
jgi:hypothetical protein